MRAFASRIQTGRSGMRHGSGGACLRWHRAWVAGLVVLAFVLTGCTWPTMGNRQAPDPTAFYNQSVQWKRCGDLECANVSVPLDWAHPSGTRISLALTKQAAINKRA